MGSRYTAVMAAVDLVCSVRSGRLTVAQHLSAGLAKDHSTSPCSGRLKLTEHITRAVLHSMPFQLRIDYRVPVFCAERTVHEVANVRVRHGEEPPFISRPLHGLVECFWCSPALKVLGYCQPSA